MGAPVDPTAAQVEQLKHESAMPLPAEEALQDGALNLELTPNTLALVKVQP